MDERGPDHLSDTVQCSGAPTWAALLCPITRASPAPGFGAVPGRMPHLPQNRRWLCVLQSLVKPPTLGSQGSHSEPAYASESSF